MAHVTSALTSVRGVNKTDVTTLVSNFGVRACCSFCPFSRSPKLISMAIVSRAVI